MPDFISEDSIQKEITRKPVGEYGCQALNCTTSDADDLQEGSGRRDKREVVLQARLKAAALRINPGLPDSAIEKALANLTAPAS